MTHIPELYRTSLREWRSADNKQCWAMYYSPDRLRDNKRSPVVDCGSDWPSEAQRKIIAACIQNHSAVIVKFDVLELAIRWFRTVTTGAGSAE